MQAGERGRVEGALGRRADQGGGSGVRTEEPTEVRTGRWGKTFLVGRARERKCLSAKARGMGQAAMCLSKR